MEMLFDIRANHRKVTYQYEIGSGTVRTLPMRDQGAANNSILVRKRLMQLIESGSLGPGGRLPTERELCENLLVGRRAVRLALESLEAEG